MSNTKSTAAEHVAAAAASRKSAQESFDRCDTDGCVTQWANDLDARLHDAKAELAAAGWTATFPGLFDAASGVRVPAVLKRGQFGFYWQIGGRFINNTRSKRGAVTKAGYVVRDQTAPADARITGTGTGLSGMTSCFIEVFRTDGGFPGAGGAR